jgi:pyridoxal phosphate phosphatase PHOSPHO2
MPLQLVVWDFDWSLVNENTDTYVFDQLAPDLRARMSALSSGGGEFAGRWTELIDHMLGVLWEERSVQPPALTAAVAETPMFEENIEAVRTLAAAGCEQRILSDANTEYIRSILQARNLAQFFPEESIVTNPAFFEPGGRLRLRPYHDTQTVDPDLRTEFTGRNLAKGAVLRAWMEKLPAGATVLYVGDGQGDFDAAVQLRPCDTLCCRAEFSLDRIINSEHGRGRVRAAVSIWRNGKELWDAIERCRAHAAQEDAGDPPSAL